MSTQFHVGQKVVCINAEWFPHPFFFGIYRTVCPLEESRIYTVSGFTEPTWCVDTKGSLTTELSGLCLVEVTNPESISRGEPDCGFDPKRFRPVETRKTDISIFKAMLNPSKEKIES